MVSYAHAQEDSNETGLKVPEDLTISTTSKYQLEELRISGRLERITVRRNGGLTEVYQNQRTDNVWQTEEDELGDEPNVRQWRLGSW